MCNSSTSGSGEGRGPWGGKPNETKLRDQIGGWATPKERQGHDDGYGKRATPKQKRTYWEGLFARVRLPDLRHVR